jgi:5'-deoxynucleotidase YfbR-like HD superfamily hydrolase
MADKWIQTFNGEYFPLEKIKGSAISIQDIAHHLSMLCRFTGATTRFYSIAEHCCHVSDRAYDITAGSSHVGMTALLHDGHEAYTGDLNTPIRSLPGMGRYNALCKEIQMHIHAQFSRYCSITPMVMATIKDADLELLLTERNQLMRQAPHAWFIDTLRNLEELPIELEGWHPARAKAEFLTRFNAYKDEIDKLYKTGDFEDDNKD